MTRSSPPSSVTRLDRRTGCPDAGLALEELCRAHDHLDRANRTVVAALKRQGIADVKPMALVILYRLSRQAQQPSRIGKALFHREKSLTHHVRLLLQRGLVEQRPHSHDGRAKVLRVTERGLAVLRAFGIADRPVRIGHPGPPLP
ncbi:MarR family transcriptional regulator [Azospirillum sp. ST 5-10]|uniref:MarR family transcriptional regulator n=1 Tax=unclassified Azospirillum TaxID=2630922 RepID=UPI003F4A069A